MGKQHSFNNILRAIVNHCPAQHKQSKGNCGRRGRGGQESLFNFSGHITDCSWIRSVVGANECECRSGELIWTMCKATDSITPQMTRNESLRPSYRIPTLLAPGTRWPPIFYVFGVTRPGIESRPTAPTADALTTRLRGRSPQNN